MLQAMHFQDNSGFSLIASENFWIQMEKNSKHCFKFSFGVRKRVEQFQLSLIIRKFGAAGVTAQSLVLSHFLSTEFSSTSAWF